MSSYFSKNYCGLITFIYVQYKQWHHHVPGIRPIVLLSYCPSNCPIVLRSFQTNMFLGQWCWTIFESNSFRLIISKLSISQNLDRFLCPFRLGRVSSYLSNYVRHPVLPLSLTDLFYNAPAKRFTSIPTGNNFLKLLQFYFLKKTTCI